MTVKEVSDDVRSSEPCWRVCTCLVFGPRRGKQAFGVERTLNDLGESQEDTLVGTESATTLNTRSLRGKVKQWWAGLVTMGTRVREKVGRRLRQGVAPIPGIADYVASVDPFRDGRVRPGNSCRHNASTTSSISGSNVPIHLVNSSKSSTHPGSFGCCPSEEQGNRSEWDRSLFPPPRGSNVLIV